MKGRATKNRERKIAEDEIRTFLESICTKLRQKKNNRKHLEVLVFFQVGGGDVTPADVFAVDICPLHAFTAVTV